MERYTKLIFLSISLLLLLLFNLTLANFSIFERNESTPFETSCHPLNILETIRKGSFTLDDLNFKIKLRTVDEKNIIIDITSSHESYYRHFLLPIPLFKLNKFLPKYPFFPPKHLLIATSNGKVYDICVVNKPEEIIDFLKGFLKKEESYIIELEGEPLVTRKLSLQNEIKKKEAEFFKKYKLLSPVEIQQIEAELHNLTQISSEKLKNYELELQSLHQRARKEIKEISSKEHIEAKSFMQVFNGIAIKANKKELEEIRKLPYVKKIYRDREVHVYLNESVPLINATRLWQILDYQERNITGKGIKIAIVDTGVDYTHPDLGGCFGSGCKVIGGYDFVNDDPDPMDDQGHGTHVAATAAGNGKFKGVAPEANILAYKVLNEFGSGSESDVIAGVERAVEDDANVISMSLGISYYWFEDCYDVALSGVVDNAVDAGVIVVVAAGNDGSEYQTIAAPGCAEKVITVGASNKTDAIAWFSSRGPHTSKYRIIPKPDVLAPGVEICAAQWDAWLEERKCEEGHISISGTSMATPHVAGVAALLLQAYPEWKPAELKSATMLGSMDLGYDVATQGAGRIDAMKAYNVPILTNPSWIGMHLVKTVANTTVIKIRNLRDYSLLVNFTLPLATSVEGGSFNISELNVSSILLPPKDEAAVSFSINLTDLTGIFFGKIVLTAESQNHTIPYAALRLIEVNVSVIGDALLLYPNICIHDDGKVGACKFQGWDFVGNSYSFLLPSRNYTAYAIGDWKNTSLEYILMNRSEVKEATTIFLNLSKARAFKVRGKSLQDVELKLYEWERIFLTYVNGTEFVFGVSVHTSDGGVGDKIIYLSDKPAGPFHTDIILRYTGVPVRR